MAGRKVLGPDTIQHRNLSCFTPLCACFGLSLLSLANNNCTAHPCPLAHITPHSAHPSSPPFCTLHHSHYLHHSSLLVTLIPHSPSLRTAPVLLLCARFSCSAPVSASISLSALTCRSHLQCNCYSMHLPLLSHSPSPFTHNHPSIFIIPHSSLCRFWRALSLPAAAADNRQENPPPPSTCMVTTRPPCTSSPMLRCVLKSTKKDKEQYRICLGVMCPSNRHCKLL